MKARLARLVAVLGAAGLLLALLLWAGRVGLNLAREALVRAVPVQASAVERAVTVEGWVLRREWVLTSPASGYLVPLAGQGEHVPRGQVLAEVVDRIERASLGHEMEQMVSERERIRQDLEAQAQAEAAFEAELERQSIALESQIAFAISFDRTEELQELLAQRERLQAEIAARRADLQRRRAELEADRERLEELLQRVETRLASATDVMRAPEAGRFELKVDGLEEVLTPDQVAELAPGYLRGLKVQERTFGLADRVVAGQPVGRLIDPRQVQIYFFLPPGHGIGVGQRVLFQAEGAERVAGRVQDVRFFGNETGLRVELEAVPDRLLEGRRVRGELILERHEGVVVPTSALVARNGTTGVLVEAGGGRLFTRVQVKGRDGAWAAVSGLAQGSRVVVNPRLLGERPAEEALAGDH